MRFAPPKLALYSLTAITAALLLFIMLSNSDGASAQQAATPTPLTRPIALSAVSAGVAHTCGLRSNGAAVCWGRYADRGLYGTAPQSGTFTSISTHRWHTCGIRPDSAVECWGSNIYGRATPPSGTFTSISAGLHHNCGIRPDSTVECWGSNYDGRSTPPSGTFTSVSAGEGHTCGVRTNGAVACWGV